MLKEWLTPNQHTIKKKMQVKGKTEPVHLYQASRLTHRHGENNADINMINLLSKTFGYERERTILKERFEKWNQELDSLRVIVEAQSGFGKSKLIESFLENVGNANVKYW
jgi:predicted AAA+ superfamily ATPase